MISTLKSLHFNLVIITQNPVLSFTFSSFPPWIKVLWKCSLSFSSLIFFPSWPNRAYPIIWEQPWRLNIVSEYPTCSNFFFLHLNLIQITTKHFQIDVIRIKQSPIGMQSPIKNQIKAPNTNSVKSFSFLCPSNMVNPLNCFELNLWFGSVRLFLTFEMII